MAKIVEKDRKYFLVKKGAELGSLITSVVVLCLFGGWLYYQQPSMVFYPEHTMIAEPNDWGLPYDDVKLSTVDGLKLQAWYIPYPESNRVVLFFHGNAGNISHRKESLEIFHKLGLNVFILDYRGYGKSEGEPNEPGLYIDSRTAWHYLVDIKKFKKENIIIFGRSLGGAVASELAADVQAGYLILESTFSSAKDMARESFKLLSYFIPIKYELNTAENVKKINTPLLVVHSPNDKVIPFKLGKKVYEAANQPKFFLELRGGHNDGFLLSQPVYEQQIEKFLSIHETD